MSTQTTEPPLYDCGHCGRSFSHAPVGSYCSAACKYRAKGEALLRQVESQSQFCDTCYGRVRDIQPLPEHTPADGFQYATPLTTVGIDVFNDQPRIEGTRVSCGCGAVNPDAGPIAELQQIHGSTVKTNLFLALRWLAARDAIDAAPDLDRYTDALSERPHDAAFACGVAVYADA